MSEIIVNHVNNYSCLGAVCAHIVGETLQDFIEFVGHDGSDITKGDGSNPGDHKAFEWYEALHYLAVHKIGLGTGVDLTESLQSGTRIEDNTRIESFFVMKDVQAIIVVTSPFWPNELHAIYWDKGKIFDPARHRKYLPLHMHEIHYIYPLVDYSL